MGIEIYLYLSIYIYLSFYLNIYIYINHLKIYYIYIVLYDLCSFWLSIYWLFLQENAGGGRLENFFFTTQGRGKRERAELQKLGLEALFWGLKLSPPPFEEVQGRRVGGLRDRGSDNLCGLMLGLLSGIIDCL